MATVLNANMVQGDPCDFDYFAETLSSLLKLSGEPKNRVEKTATVITDPETKRVIGEALARRFPGG